MPESVKIELLPLGKTLSVPRGAPLREVLFTEGVEFPCGGRGRCKGCRIRVLEGHLPVTSEDERLLTPGELGDGWRLSCRANTNGALKLELAQWEPAILEDHAGFEFTPREGLGIAVDLGTTTLVAQWVDLTNGNVLGVATALNAQARYGADIMSRIDFALHSGEETLQRTVREQIGNLLLKLFDSNPGRASEVRDVILVGNTVMHHLFCGVPVEPLSHFPFESEQLGLQTFTAGELGWHFECRVRFLPCLGGFVGSDILAGILATHLHEQPSLAALIDLGTNGEIVVGTKDRMLCASTAAGPAFEGARISMGMRAATGAISEATWEDGRIHCRVLGNVEARGVCGSGLVDAVAAGLTGGLIHPTGRLAAGKSLPLVASVALTQKDIRELQLAKGAIAAGIRILLQRWAAGQQGLSKVWLAGAFGNYISRASARRIGLLDFPPEQVEPAGNTALRGAKMALCGPVYLDLNYPDLRRKVQHVSLHEDEQFQEIYVEQMQFPG